MKFTIFSKVHIVSLLAIIAYSSHQTNGSPLYEEKFKQPGAKVILPDPLEAAPSAELPMVHNNNYDMIMADSADDAHPAASMQFQNFEKFFDPEMIDDENEYKMMESQFVHSNPIRAPQPLSAEERRVRQKLEDADEKREKKQLLKLKKGTSKPRIDAPQWDQFDYDYYTGNPDKKHKKSYYG